MENHTTGKRKSSTPTANHSAHKRCSFSHEKFIKSTPKTADIVKKKRRRSIKRQSLVDVLKLNTESSSSTVQDYTSSVEPLPRIKENVIKKCEEKSAETNSAQPSHYTFSNRLFVEHTKDADNIPDIVHTENDDVVTTSIKAEIKKWDMLEKQYKALEMETEENAISKDKSSDLHLNLQTSKYTKYTEDLDDLEDKIATAVSTVSNAMTVIHKLRELKEIKLKKDTESKYSNSERLRGGKDPRFLIENIFKLENISVTCQSDSSSQ